MLQIGNATKSGESIFVTADGSRAKQIMLEIDKLPFKDTSAISASVKPCWVLWINCYGGDVIYGQAIVGFDPARASIITSEYSIHCTDINH